MSLTCVEFLHNAVNYRVFNHIVEIASYIFIYAVSAGYFVLWLISCLSVLFTSLAAIATFLYIGS